MNLSNELLLKIIESYTISTQEELIAVYRQREVSRFWFLALDPLLKQLLGELIVSSYEILASETIVLSKELENYIGLREKLYGLCTRERFEEFLWPGTPLENCYLMEKEEGLRRYHSLLVETEKESVVLSLRSSQGGGRVLHSTKGGTPLPLPKGNAGFKRLSWERLSLIPGRYFTTEILLTLILLSPIFISGNNRLSQPPRSFGYAPKPLLLKDPENCAFQFSPVNGGNELIYLQTPGKAYLISAQEFPCSCWSELRGELLPGKELAKFRGFHQGMINLLKRIQIKDQPFYSCHRLISPELISLFGQPFLRRVF